MMETETVRGVTVNVETDTDDRGKPILRFTVDDNPRPYFSIRGMLTHYPKVSEQILEACQEIFEYGLPEPYGEKMMRAIDNAKKPF